MRLSQISQLFGARGVEAARTILTGSPFLSYLDANSAFELDKMDFDWRPASNTYSAQTRARGGSLTATDITWEAKQSGSQVVLGGALDIDIRNKRDAELGLDNLDVQLQKNLLRAWNGYALSVQNKLFNGTGAGSPTELKGLKTILDGSTDLPGYTGVKGVINAANYSKESSPKSLDMTVDKAGKYFTALMLDTLNEVSNPTGIVMNNKLFAAITQFAEVQRTLESTTNNYGTILRTLWGVPVILVDGTTIGVTEPDDTTTPLENTTSMYVMSPGELKTSLVTNSGLYYIEYDHLENKESGREKWEMSLAWKIEDTTSIRRVRNIKV